MSDTQDYNELHELQTVKVDKGQGPIRIDKFLMARMEQMSRNRLQNGIDDGLITVRPHDVIKVYLTEAPRDRTILPEEMDLDIVYEDDDVMVINKPPGLVVHPGVGNYSGTLVNGLAHYFQNHPLPLKEGNDNDRPGLVHRIDKETSGLMVIAKNENAMTHLAAQFFDHSIDR